MKKLFLALLMMFILLGCKTVYIPVEKKVTVKETVRDTIVDVQIEREYVKQAIPDTTSTVETKYAKSTAIWHGDSETLEHIIENKPDSISIRVQFVDREVEVEKPAPYPVEVEVPVDRPIRMPLRWYEHILQYLGMAALGGGVLWVVARFKSR
ncbi:hypothetical protein [Bacteroides stercorirosoris]|uniref:Uncharacterized protein n=1 Tax=Bacteroides stercorirosoris TaxID=871324 RepID=A0A1M6L4R4_9BACE|nr:hypothetical protein [Bacteroides stercorirosoris]SHJ66180.1 hypothetical protein SAMN05444350_14418 [Bacteroides stercorirosoris]